MREQPWLHDEINHSFTPFQKSDCQTMRCSISLFSQNELFAYRVLPSSWVTIKSRDPCGAFLMKVAISPECSVELITQLIIHFSLTYTHNKFHLLSIAFKFSSLFGLVYPKWDLIRQLFSLQAEGLSNSERWRKLLALTEN